MRSPTIKDVAKHAGVSTATVSRVISGKNYVSPEIEEKVKRTIKLLNYRPNAIARSLKGEGTYTIGVIVSDIANPFFMRMAKALEDTVSAHNYNIMVCSAEEDAQKELKYLNMLSQKRVDGIILSATGENNEYIRQLSKSGVPMILIDRKHEDLELDLITDDNYYGGYMLTDYLIQKGHRKIAIIKGHPKSTTSNERLYGFHKALDEAGIQFNNDYVFDGGYSGEYAPKIVNKILEMDNGPTAVFAVNNLIAVNIIMEMNVQNKRIPEDLSLVCYGLDEFKTLFIPSITCIVQNPSLIGIKAGELIMERIKAPFIAKKTDVIFAPQMFIGESVQKIIQ